MAPTQYGGPSGVTAVVPGGPLSAPPPAPFQRGAGQPGTPPEFTPPPTPAPPPSFQPSWQAQTTRPDGSHGTLPWVRPGEAPPPSGGTQAPAGDQAWAKEEMFKRTGLRQDATGHFVTADGTPVADANAAWTAWNGAWQTLGKEQPGPMQVPVDAQGRPISAIDGQPIGTPGSYQPPPVLTPPAPPPTFTPPTPSSDPPPGWTRLPNGQLVPYDASRFPQTQAPPPAPPAVGQPGGAPPPGRWARTGAGDPLREQKAPRKLSPGGTY
jgi:hypothetical protein